MGTIVPLMIICSFFLVGTGKFRSLTVQKLGVVTGYVYGRNVLSLFSVLGVKVIHILVE